MSLPLYALLCFILPNTIWIFVNFKKTRENKNIVRHIVWCYIFMLYCYLAVYDAAGIGTIWDLIYYGELKSTINLVPFSSKGITTYLLNIIMFVPLGFLLPLIWKNFRVIEKVLFVGFSMSLMIEIAQLFCLRVTDVDDLIMNTVGTLIGYFCWVLFKGVFHKAGSKAIQLNRNEPLIYIVLGILGIVLFYNCR